MIKAKAAVKNAALLGFTCFISYSACYIGRNILSSMLPQMIQNNVYGKESLSMMGSVFFVTYGLGQLINGMIGNRISAKYMVFTGLFLSGILSVLFPLFYSELLSLVLWGVCGFLCSMLWGPLSKLVGENTSIEYGRILMTMLTIASIAGTSVTYFLAIFGALRNNWKLGFLIAGFLLVAVSVIWFLLVTVMERKGIVKKKSIEQTAKQKVTIQYFLNIGFITIVLVTMLNGVIRNAVAFWIPTFISEQFHVSAAAAAAVSAIVPFVNLAGTLFTVFAAKRFHNDEGKMLTILFAYSTLMFAVIFFLNGKYMVINMIALFTASAAMTGACNVIFSFYVLRFADTGKLSGLTGFLDFTSYVSASAANVLFSSLLTKYGWNMIVSVWTATTLLGIIFSWISMKSGAPTADGCKKEALSH